jgi:ribosomal peptide maturation radical SAM protein 1
MPWSDVHTGLGICTLKAILNRAGLPTDTRFPNMRMAQRVGSDWYDLLTSACGPRFSPEVLFTPHVFDRDPGMFAATVLPRFYETVFEWFNDTQGMRPPRAMRDAFPDLTRKVCIEDIPAFLDEFMAGIEWERYDLVGFSVMSGQVLASVAGAQRIKQCHPEKIVIFGGPSCDEPMGMELLRCFSCLDVVVPGEADLNIVPLITALRHRRPLGSIRGLVVRRGRECVSTGKAETLADLDDLPMPDFDDYVRELSALDGVPPFLFFETSRGCWWGVKHQCRFCGLNCKGLAYRRKSAARAFAEIITLADRYRTENLRATDTIFDLRYCRELLPMLAAANAMRPSGRRLRVFYETKSNLRKDQMRLMKAAGIVELQPGIESFSNGLLSLMNKGNTCLHQIQCLKWADELDIAVDYGILFGLPGERTGHYDEMHDIIDSLCHLSPPRYLSPVFLERFSPYFDDPARYGIQSIEPHQHDRLIFSDARINLNNLLFRFRFAYPDSDNRDLVEARDRCLKRLRRWRDGYRRGTLLYTVVGDRVLILDRRNEEPALLALDGDLGRLYSYLDSSRSFPDIERTSAVPFRARLRGYLNWLCRERLIYHDAVRDRYLALAVEGRIVAQLRTLLRERLVHDVCDWSQ